MNRVDRATELAATGPAETLGALVQAYAGVQCRVILEKQAAIAAQDEDAVHPVRVAIRRLRATLSTFGGVYRRGDREGLANELRWAGALLGDVRDLQVLAERFASDDTASLSARQLIGRDIARRQAVAWRAAEEGYASERGSALFARLERWQDDPPFGSGASLPARRARRRVKKSDDRVRTGLRDARDASDAGGSGTAEFLHDARKAAKRHRYAVELARPVLGDDADATIERRESLQDALGAHQDAVVALAFLRSIDLGAESPETTAALQALIARAQQSADDVAGVLRETEREA